MKKIFFVCGLCGTAAVIRADDIHEVKRMIVADYINVLTLGTIDHIMTKVVEIPPDGPSEFVVEITT